MKLNDYQNRAKETAIYPGKGTIMGLLYTTLGLCGEAGEFADKVKKILRDSDGVITAEIEENLVKELGDVMWYASQTCEELYVSLEEVCEKNLKKLLERAQGGKLKGSGDNR